MDTSLTLATELGITHYEAFVAIERAALGGFSTTQDSAEGFPVLAVIPLVADAVRQRVRATQEARRVLPGTPERFREVSAGELSEWQREAHRRLHRI